MKKKPALLPPRIRTKVFRVLVRRSNFVEEKGLRRESDYE